MFNNKKIYFSQIPVGRALARTKGPTTADFHNRCSMRCMTAQRSVAPLFPTSPSARNGAFILLITLVCSTQLCVAPGGRFCVSCYNDHGNGLGWFLLFLVFGDFFFPSFFFVILVLKVIIPPLFDFSTYGIFRKIPATPRSAKFSNLSIFPPLDRVRSALRWKYRANFRQRSRCAPQLPSPSPSRAPPLPRDTACVVTGLRYSSPHVSHSYTVNFILFLLLGPLTCSISLLLYADDLSSPLCHRQISTAASHYSRQELPLILFSHLSFFFYLPSKYILVYQTLHHDYGSEPSLFETLAVGLSVRFCAPWLDRFQSFQGVFQDLHVSTTRGY